MNILITAASRRFALVRAFREALTKFGKPGRVVSSDMSPLSPGLYAGHGHRFVPPLARPDYLPRLLEVCREEKIEFLIPTMDEELPYIARHRKKLLAGGVTPLVSDWTVCSLCNDKLESFRFLQTRGIPTIQTWLPSELNGEAGRIPLFIKPRFGRGSEGTFKVRDTDELSFLSRYVDDPVVQPFLEGPEYTVDVLSDLNGQVLSVVPRRRLLVRAGVSDRGRTVREPSLISLCEQVATELNTQGPINIQCFNDGGEWRVIEINPRFSGGIPLTIASGADFPFMILQFLSGERVEPRVGSYQDGVIMTNYAESVFLIDGNFVPSQENGSSVSKSLAWSQEEQCDPRSAA